MTEKQITSEKQHEIRYYVQQCFIPMLVESVKEGYLPFISLFPSAQWYSNLRAQYDIEDINAAKVCEKFERIELDEDRMIILYTFPQPEEATEALYGAILYDGATGDVQYFTLEATCKGRWAKCSRSVSMHSIKGIHDSADKDVFLQWVMGFHLRNGI